MTEKRPPGTPPGVIKNPTGKNQYSALGLESRGKSFGLRLPLTLDAQFRQAIEEKGITATVAMTEAVELWLKNYC